MAFGLIGKSYLNYKRGLGKDNGIHEIKVSPRNNYVELEWD